MECSKNEKERRSLEFNLYENGEEIEMYFYGFVWFGMVLYGLVWYGLVWFGMVWYGLVWFGLVWFGWKILECSAMF